MSSHLINNAASVSLKGVKSVRRHLKQEEARSDKAMNTAIRVEGFRLRKRMQIEIRRGAPGGRPFVPLSFIARRIWRRANRKPLEALAKGVRYDVNPKPPFTVAVGFVGPMTWTEADLNLGFVGRRVNQYSPELTRDSSLNPLNRGISRSNISSKKWRWLAEQHQEGFDRDITDRQRWWIVRRGGDLMNHSRLDRDDISDTPFFLKSSTKRFSTPARPIINPFWQAHKTSAPQNIRRNFKRKMAGRRISDR